ncbi:unnamed protein product [Prunus armeniaca]
MNLAIYTTPIFLFKHHQLSLLAPTQRLLTLSSSMAKKMMLKVVILVSLLIFQLADSHETVTTPPVESPHHPPVESPHPPPKIECNGECNRRCKLSSRPNLCKRACGTCCERCNCVPPGTSGHYETCPCYANMTTHRGLHKCP